MTITEIGSGVAILTGLFYLIRWTYRCIRNYEINEAFVKDVAQNHLPHVQHALHKIAEHLGIDLGEPPPIRFMKFNGKS